MPRAAKKRARAGLRPGRRWRAEIRLTVVGPALRAGRASPVHWAIHLRTPTVLADARQCGRGPRGL